MTMPPVFRSMRLHSAGAKACSRKGFHSFFWYRYAWMWLIRVFTRSVSSPCTTMPGALLTSRICSSSYKMSSLGLNNFKKAFSGVGISKNSSLMYNCSRSPTCKRVSRFAPLPLSFTRLRRMYFCASGAGRRGRFLDSQRSKRWLASFFPTVNSFMDGMTPWIQRRCRSPL